ncbi:serine/threonine-protein kinase [Acrocarpospora catenulata]|uniref:serine/threonine-protein kinase n=1 Tax=Acrocarpospora catenulata TaxID=2836182 RepID=UPI001BD981BA|nr:serine/threonine-protein kinase [Acrocarpospora catenulata]
MPLTQPLRPGDPATLGAYRVTGRLGEGAQGVVYAGTGPDGTAVAIKLLRARIGEGAVTDADGFLREIAAARRVAQFCTAQVLDASMDGEHPYIVSELVDGVSLQRVVREEGPRRDGALYRLAVGTITALAAIHRAGIVHRDFKPSNVLLGADGPRVIDFGISRALDSSVTLSSGVVGTPAYMSPEQIAAQRVGPPSDMFSWAVTMIYAATGVPAFGVDSLPAVIYRVINDEPDVSKIPERLRPLVQSCLAKNQDERPTAAEALFSLLDQQATDSPRPAPAASGAPAMEIDLDRSMSAGLRVAATDSLPPTPSPAPVNPFASPSYDPEAEDSVTIQARRPEPLSPPPPPPPPPPLPPVFLPDNGEQPPRKRAGLVTGALVGAVALAVTALLVVPALVDGDKKAQQAQSTPMVSSSGIVVPAPGVSNTTDPVASPSPTIEKPGPISAATAPPTLGKEIGKPLSGHRGAVYSVTGATVGDTPVLVSTGTDRQVRLWNADTRKPMGKAMTGHGDEVYAVAAATVSGRPLAVTGSRDGTIRVWDLKKRKPVGGALYGHSNAVYTVAIGKVGSRWVAASGGVDGRIRLWDLKKRKPIGRAINAHRDVINWLAFGDLNGTPIIVSASEDRTLRVWNAKTRKAVGKAFRDHKKPVYSVTTGDFSGFDIVASGGRDNKIRIWDPKTGKAIQKTLTGHKGTVYSLAFAKVNNEYPILVSGSTDGTIRLWDLRAFKAIGKPVKAHKGGVFSVAVVEVDGRPVIVSAGKDRRLKEWRLEGVDLVQAS